MVKPEGCDWISVYRINTNIRNWYIFSNLIHWFIILYNLEIWKKVSDKLSCNSIRILHKQLCPNKKKCPDLSTMPYPSIIKKCFWNDRFISSFQSQIEILFPKSRNSVWFSGLVRFDSIPGPMLDRKQIVMWLLTRVSELRSQNSLSSTKFPDLTFSLSKMNAYKFCLEQKTTL